MLLRLLRVCYSAGAGGEVELARAMLFGYSMTKDLNPKKGKERDNK